MSTIVKRSVVLNKKKTSISLEPEFWHEIQALGHANGGIGNFVTGIKLSGAHANLSSALRVAVLAQHKKRIADLVAKLAEARLIAESEGAAAVEIASRAG